VAVNVDEALRRVRDIALGLPDTNERPSHGMPTFFIRDKKTFLSFVNDHHGDGILGLWCAAPPGAQEALIANDAVRFYRPAYVGSRGWVGVRLDVRPNWKLVAATIEDGYHFVLASMPKAARVRPS
jgi:hypothetical protein